VANTNPRNTKKYVANTNAHGMVYLEELFPALLTSAELNFELERLRVTD
jgi:hypothetical protein